VPETLFDREQYKAKLRARGLEVTDRDIDEFLAQQQFNQPQQDYSPAVTGVSPNLSWEDVYSTELAPSPYAGMDPYADMYGSPTQEAETTAWGLVSNTLWSFLDTATFGIAEAVVPDIYEPVPDTVAEKVAAGLGSFGGMLVPFGLAKGAVSAVSRGVGRGSQAVASRITQKGTDYLAKTAYTGAGSKGSGKYIYSKLSQEGREGLFKPVTEPLNYMHKLFAKGTSEKRFLELLDDGLKNGITQQLKAAGLPYKKVMKDLKNIVENEILDSAGNLPLHTLARRLEVALSRYGLGTIAGGKLAWGLAHAIEEGVFFAAAETPFEVVNYTEGFFNKDGEIAEGTTAWNIAGRAGHAFVIGNMLGAVKSFIPGGKIKGNVIPAFKQMTRKMRDSNFMRYDMSTAAGRNAIGDMANLLMNKGASKLLNDKSGLKQYLSSTTSIKEMLHVVDDATGTYKNAIELQKSLFRIQKEFLSGYRNSAGELVSEGWWKLWLSEMGQDYAGSAGRMIAGSLVMTANDSFIPGGMLFNPDVPLEDKIMSIALGAFISKKGNNFKYRDANGREVAAAVGDQAKFTYSKRFEDLSTMLDFMSAPNENAIFLQRLRTEIAEGNFLKAEKTPDVQALANAIESHKLFVDVNQDIKQHKNAANSESHPIYGHLELLYNSSLRDMVPGKRMKNLSEIDSQTAMKLERALTRMEFGSTLTKGGIHTPVDLLDIILDANKKVYHSLMNNVLKDYTVRMYNELAGDAYQTSTDKPFMNYIAKPLDNKNRPDARMDIMLTKFNRVRDFLAKHGIIEVPKDKERGSIPLEIEKLDKLESIIAEAEAELNKVWFGGEDVSLDQWRPFGDDLVFKVIDGQAFHHGTRQAQKMLWNLEDPVVWEADPGDIKSHDGLRLKKLLFDMFVDENGKLFRQIDIEGGRGYENMGQFMEVMRSIMSLHPQTKNPFFEGMGKTKTVKASDVREAMKILEGNGIKGFSYSDAAYVDNFARQVENIALERKLMGATRADTGAPLNGLDRSIIQYLFDSGLANKNYQLVDRVEIVRDMIATISAFKEKDPRFFGKYFAKSATDQLQMMHDKSNMFDFLEELQRTAKQKNMSKEALWKEVVDMYESLISPYMRTQVKVKGKFEERGLFESAAGAGEIKAEMSAQQLWDFIEQINTIKVANTRTSHQDLVARLAEIKDGREWSREQRDFLNYLYGNLFQSGSDSHRAIHMLKKLGLYKDENTGTFDLEGATQMEKMKEYMSLMDLDMKPQVSGAAVSKIINDFTSRHDHYNTSLDIHRTMTVNDFKKKYNIPDDLNWDDTQTVDNLYKFARVQSGADKSKLVDFSDPSVGEQVKEIWFNDVVSVLRTHYANRSMKRYTAVNGYGIVMEDTNVTDNSLFRLLDKVVGKGNYNIIDLSLIDAKDGIKDGRTDSATERIIAEQFFNNISATSKDLGVDYMGDIEFAKIGPHYISIHGDLKWGVAIRAEKADQIAQDFVDFVNRNRSKRKNYKDVISDFEDIINHHLNIKEEVVLDPVTNRPKLDKKGIEITRQVAELRKGGPHNDGMVLESMINAMWLDGNGMDGVGVGRFFWDHLKATRNGKDPFSVTKLSRRLRMMSNISGTELSSKLIADAIRLGEQAGIDTDVLKGLKDLEKDKMNFVVIADEGKGAVEGEYGWSSVISDARKQIEAELAQNKGLTGRQDLDPLNPLDPMSEASMVDSYAILNPFNEKYKGLRALSGVGHLEDVGALKYHLHKLGGELDSFLGKTGLFMDERFNGFFQANDTVDMLIFDSGSKLKSDRLNQDVDNNLLHTDFTSFKDLNKVVVDTDKIQTIGVENMTHMSVKGPLKEATIPYQLTNHLSLKANNAMFDWLLKDKLVRYKDETKQVFSSSNPIDALAYAKYINGDPTIDSGSSYFDYLLDAGMYPPTSELMLPTFKALVKRRNIDDAGLMSMKNNRGGQSVASSDLPGDGRLRNSSFEIDADNNRVQYTIGQMDIPYSARNKIMANMLNMHVVKHNKSAKDQILTWKEFLKDVDSKVDYGNRESLGWVYDTITDISKKTKADYEVLVASHRNPSTRPGDVILTGLRGFAGEKDGNTARINSWDGKYRSEIDFDTDLLNWWVDTPNIIVKEWHDMAGVVKHAPVHDMAQKTSLGIGSPGGEYNWFAYGNLGSMRKYNRDQAKAKYMVGQVSKTQRVIEHVKENKIEINLPNGTKLTFNNDKSNDISNNLARDIQNIVDSTTGYDSNAYSDLWFNNFIFGSAEKPGIFKRVDKEGATQSFIENTIERELIKQAIRPYQGLLQLSTGLYESGKRKNIRYDDILEQVRSYDDSMRNLNIKAYWNLRKARTKNGDKKVNESDLNEVFKVKLSDDGKKVVSIGNPYGDFVNKMQIRSADNFENLLPFERTMAMISHADAMSVEGPRKLFGEAHATFEKVWNEYLDMGETSQMYSKMVGDVSKDTRLLGYANYLDWRIKQKRSLITQHLNDGNKNYAGHIEQSLHKLEKHRGEIEEQFVTDKNIAEMIAAQAQYRTRGDILNTLRTPVDMDGPSRFPTISAALNWVNNNNSVITKYARTKPFKFKGINDSEYRTLVILNQQLGAFRDIHIDPGTYESWSKDMSDDLYKFNGEYSNLWKAILNKDKNRNPVLDETNLNKMLEGELGRLFEKWELRNPGLGRLFLWKFMAPSVDPGTVTYFNGTLSEGFKPASLGRAKMGLRFIFGADDGKFNEMDKRTIAEIFARKHNGFTDAFYGRQVTKASMEHQWLEAHMESRDKLFTITEPLLDPEGVKYKPEDIQTAMNPQIANAFGYENNFSVGYILSHDIIDPRSIGEMVKGMSHSTMPTGYIPFEYMGHHPRITGWSTYNDAKYRDARVMLGDVLGKNIIRMQNTRPVMEVPFRGTGTKVVVESDMNSTVDNKVNIICD
jgi:hypothetical protein